MSSRISLNALLNPGTAHVEPGQAPRRDARPLLKRLADHIKNHSSSVDVTSETYQALLNLVNSLPIPHNPAPAALVPSIPSLYTQGTVPSEILYNAYLNDRTILSKLLFFDNPSAYVEFPETHPSQPIGYCFRMEDVDHWRNPMLDFAYPRGAPAGCSRKGADIRAFPLRDKDTDDTVPCRVTHNTCLSVLFIFCATSQFFPRPRHKNLSRGRTSR